MAEAFFTRSERKANIDHETICRMSAYKYNLETEFIETRNVKLLREIIDTEDWLIKLTTYSK